MVIYKAEGATPTPLKARSKSLGVLKRNCKTDYWFMPIIHVQTCLFYYFLFRTFIISYLFFCSEEYYPLVSFFTKLHYDLYLFLGFERFSGVPASRYMPSFE